MRDATLTDYTDLVIAFLCLLSLSFGIGYHVRDLQARKQIQQVLNAPKRIEVTRADWSSFRCGELKNICNKRPMKGL